jgi:outer membrane protein OmpA-like peptidoglycan-associated protein
MVFLASERQALPRFRHDQVLAPLKGVRSGQAFESQPWLAGNQMNKQMMTGAALFGALWLGGCATEDYVNKHVATVQGQVDTVKGHAGEQDARLSATDKTAHEALERAQAAGKLAQGKFLYSMVLTDDATKFPVNGSTLSDEAKSRLTEFANKLKSDNRNVYLEIQGYTDSKGAPQANLALGQARADAVRLYLNEQGVALNRMATISYGQDNPVAPNDTRDGRAQNRRVVLVVLE